MVIAEQHWQIENSQTAREKHRTSHSLYCELEIGTDGVNVVINAKQEDQQARQQNCQQRFRGESKAQAGIPTADQNRSSNAKKKSHEDGHATQSRQRSAMKMSIERWHGNPSAGRGCVPYVPGENE